MTNWWRVFFIVREATFSAERWKLEPNWLVTLFCV